MMKKKIFSNSWLVIALAILSLLVLGCIVYCSYLYYEDFNNSMLDLGNISQSVWNITQGKSLVYTAFHGQSNRLNSHAELILFLISPIYKLIPNPLTLITVQALIFVLGTIPVFRLANRHLENKTFALLLSLSYLLYPVALTGVFFDIHGDTIAMPLLLFVIDAADREETIEFIVFCILSLACKSYVVIPVSLLALLFLIENKRKFCLYTFGVIFVWEIIFNAGRYFLINQHASNTIAGLSTSAIDHYFQTSLESLINTLPERLLNGAIALFPALILGIFAVKKIIPALIVMVPVLFSSGPGPVYRYTTHHYGFVVPFLIAGMVYGTFSLKKGVLWISNIGGNQKNRWKVYVVATFITVLIFDFVFLPLPFTVISKMNPDVAENLIIDSRDRMKKDWLRENIPDGASLMADTFLASHLTNRKVLYRTTYLDSMPKLNQNDIGHILDQIDYLVLDIFSPYGNYDLAVKKEALENEEFSLIKARDGLLLFKAQEGGLNEDIMIDHGDYHEIQKELVSGINVVNSKIENIGNLKYRLTLTWMKTKKIPDGMKLVAVSRIDGVDHSRIVHLPSLLLDPFPAWEEGKYMKEVVEFTIPVPLEKDEFHKLYLGLYDYSSGFSTNSTNRLGDEISIGTISGGDGK